MLKKCRLEIEDFGRISTEPGNLFLEVLNRYCLDLHNDCGGNGKCGKCRIVFHTDAPACLPADEFYLTPEERDAGCRLACFHQIRDDCRIEIPEPKSVELLDDL